MLPYEDKLLEHLSSISEWSFYIPYKVLKNQVLWIITKLEENCCGVLNISAWLFFLMLFLISFLHRKSQDWYNINSTKLSSTQAMYWSNNNICKDQHLEHFSLPFCIFLTRPSRCFPLLYLRMSFTVCLFFTLFCACGRIRTVPTFFRKQKLRNY